MTIQTAVNAAHDGDTIAIAPGTYPGGVTIDVSVTVVGAGAASTIIKGGGPVLTLGVPGAPNPPTISITGVTVTGGVASGNGDVTFVGLGGGVSIPGIYREHRGRHRHDPEQRDHRQPRHSGNDGRLGRAVWRVPTVRSRVASAAG